MITYTNGSSQYTLNMETIVSKVILALVRSVAVHSINTFFVLVVILVCSPEMTIKIHVNNIWEKR